MLKSTKKIKHIYLDYSSSVLPNPSSIHTPGIGARKKLEEARLKVALVFNVRSRNIIFTSGATESNNLAIQGILFAWRKNKKDLPHLITTNIEHSSVFETYKMLAERGLAEISIIPVEESGIVDIRKIKKEIKKNTILISIMYANNEIGTIEPIREIAKEVRHYKKTKGKKFLDYPFFHIDAAQAVNYLDLNVEKLGVDLLSLSGSKIEKAGKTGVLYKRENIPLLNIFGGGNQEMGFRPGTENLTEILKFTKALEFTQKIKEKESKRLIKLRDYFIKKITKLDSKIKINGDLKNRLPNNINITIPKIPSDLLVIELSARGIYVSEKSACKSGDKAGSYVIKAIRTNQESDGSVRFSLGRDTTKNDIDYTLKELSEILKKLKKWYN